MHCCHEPGMRQARSAQARQSQRLLSCTGAGRLTNKPRLHARAWWGRPSYPRLLSCSVMAPKRGRSSNSAKAKPAAKAKSAAQDPNPAALEGINGDYLVKLQKAVTTMQENEIFEGISEVATLGINYFLCQSYK